MRLDLALVERGLAASREQARRLIERGSVEVDGVPVLKASRKVDESSVVKVLAGEKYASRGGEKLEAALHGFGIDPWGMLCLDIGISTGGFADCLLQAGAKKVIGVDVGHGQLAEKLKSETRLELREGVNARELAREMFAERFDLVVADVSFISLLKILPPAIELVREGGSLIALIKPQFEVGKDLLPKDGVVKNEADRQDAVRRIESWLAERSGWRTEPVLVSPIKGGDGNLEFLICGRKSST